ncbi:MAG: 23S rRNA (uridine(2552)-2'-O)-methyltransferase [Promethearchaeota archaeon]
MRHGPGGFPDRRDEDALPGDGDARRRREDPRTRDYFYLRAKREGRRARSYFKLEEMDRKLHLLGGARVVVDLCCAPGAWLEYCVEVASKVQSLRERPPVILGVDRVEVEPLEGASVLVADLDDPNFLYVLRAAIKNALPGSRNAPGREGGLPGGAGDSDDRLVDVLLSDCSPHTRGGRSRKPKEVKRDATRQARLFALSYEVARATLVPGGTFVGKLFEGANFGHWKRKMWANFAKVTTFKPQASRKTSPEKYLVGRGFGQAPEPWKRRKGWKRG